MYSMFVCTYVHSALSVYVHPHIHSLCVYILVNIHLLIRDLLIKDKSDTNFIINLSNNVTCYKLTVIMVSAASLCVPRTPILYKLLIYSVCLFVFQSQVMGQRRRHPRTCQGQYQALCHTPPHLWTPRILSTETIPPRSWHNSALRRVPL